MNGSDADFGEWLQEQLDRRDMSQADFTRVGKFTTANVSRWINNERMPSSGSAVRIARVFGIDEDIVLSLTGHKPPIGQARPPRSVYDEMRAALQRAPRAIPHHSQLVSAGKGEPMIDGFVYLEEGEIAGPNDFALTVTGMCMDPEISPGDYVVVNPDRIAETGSLLVFTLDDEQVMVKRLAFRNGQRWLEPRNGDPILYDERVRPAGVVRRVIKRY